MLNEVWFIHVVVRISLFSWSCITILSALLFLYFSLWADIRCRHLISTHIINPCLQNHGAAVHEAGHRREPTQRGHRQGNLRASPHAPQTPQAQPHLSGDRITSTLSLNSTMSVT